MKRIIGVYGLSGSGKTTLCNYLKNLSCFVIDADKIGREILSKESTALKSATEIFGKDILLKDGSLNRKKLGKIVFADRKKLELLNSITKLKIEEEISRQIESAPDGTVIIDCAILPSLSIKDKCDEMILIRAEKNTLIKRLLARENISKKTAADRIERQLEESDGVYTLVVDNNGNPDMLKHAAEKIYSERKI